MSLTPDASLAISIAAFMTSAAGFIVNVWYAKERVRLERELLEVERGKRALRLSEDEIRYAGAVWRRHFDVPPDKDAGQDSENIK